MPKKQAIADEAPVAVEVAPECQHVNVTEMRQDDETRVFVVRKLCPKCGWSSSWVPQRDAVLTPIEAPVIERF